MLLPSPELSSRGINFGINFEGQITGAHRDSPVSECNIATSVENQWLAAKTKCNRTLCCCTLVSAGCCSVALRFAESQRESMFAPREPYIRRGHRGLM